MVDDVRLPFPLVEASGIGLCNLIVFQISSKVLKGLCSGIRNYGSPIPKYFLKTFGQRDSKLQLRIWKFMETQFSPQEATYILLFQSRNYRANLSIY